MTSPAHTLFIQYIDLFCVYIDMKFTLNIRGAEHFFSLCID